MVGLWAWGPATPAAGRPPLETKPDDVWTFEHLWMHKNRTLLHKSCVIHMSHVFEFCGF